jgi:hypothetical protein
MDTGVYSTRFNHDGSKYSSADDLQVLNPGKFIVSSNYFGRGLGVVSLN